MLIPVLRKERKYTSFKKSKDQTIIKKIGGVKIRLYKDSVLSELIYNNRFENSELKFLKKYLKKNDQFVDIGANIGLFSLIAANCVKEGGSVISFEPTPRTFNRLVENVSLNKFLNVKCYPYALSERNGTVSFYLFPEGKDAWNTMSKPETGLFEEIKVESIAIDDFNFLNNNFLDKTTLIKIDVEGLEMSVFKGGGNFFSSKNAPTLMVEFCDLQAQNANCFCSDLYILLESYGYKLYKYDCKRNALIWQENKTRFIYENLIAIKETSYNNRITRFQ